MLPMFFSPLEEVYRLDRIHLNSLHRRCVPCGTDAALEAERAEPLVIRDHARKFQFIVSHGMLFRRNEDA